LIQKRSSKAVNEQHIQACVLTLLRSWKKLMSVM